MPPPPPGASPRRSFFQQTPWLILRCPVGARAGKRRRALAELCRIYREPILCVICQRGYSRHDAEDLTQGFLLHFIKSGAIARAHPSKGRFRDFLIGALGHYLHDVRRRADAIKRGGGQQALNWDEVGERELHCQSVAERGGGALALDCDQLWALNLLGDVFERLRTQYARDGREELFRLIKSYLIGDETGSAAYANLARRLRRPVVTLRSDVRRFREQMRVLLHAQICLSVGRERAEHEMRSLIEILRGK